MSYHEFLWIYSNLFCKYMWSVLNIYLFFIQDISLKSGTLHTIVREKYTSYSCLRRGYFFYGGVITLPVSHEEKWPLGHFFKKKFNFSPAWMSLFLAGKWPRSSSYGDRYSFLHCLRGGITDGSPINLYCQNLSVYFTSFTINNRSCFNFSLLFF